MSGHHPWSEIKQNALGIEGMSEGKQVDMLNELNLDAQVDQAIADNQAVAKAAQMAYQGWTTSDWEGIEPDHTRDWSPAVLGGNEWRRPTLVELAIHMMRMLESLRGSEIGLRELTSGHIRMWLDEEDALHIALEMV